MAPRSRTGQPRRVLSTASPVTATADPRKAVRRNRYIRGGIAGVAAVSVGLLAFVVPGVATDANAASVAPASVQTSGPRVGTTDAFSSRTESVSRSVGREALSPDAVAAAATARATALADVTEQVTSVQVDAALATRAQALSDTTARIDAEVERINSRTFLWPTDGGLTSEWGPRLHPILHYVRLHAGSDIGGVCGQPIWAAADGVVTATGYAGQSGNNVRIDHGDIGGKHVETSYLHMTAYSVEVGQTVRKGEQIGTVGSTGLSTACHLHFATYEDGANINPRTYLDS